MLERGTSAQFGRKVRFIAGGKISQDKNKPFGQILPEDPKWICVSMRPLEEGIFKRQIV